MSSWPGSLRPGTEQCRQFTLSLVRSGQAVLVAPLPAVPESVESALSQARNLAAQDLLGEIVNAGEFDRLGEVFVADGGSVRS